MINLLSAAAAGSDAPPAWLQFLPLVGMVVIFWFLIIRPQMRRQKEHQKKIGALKKGDQVVTAGGLIAKVVKVDDHFVDLELGQGVKVRAVKNTIGEVLAPGATPAAND